MEGGGWGGESPNRKSYDTVDGEGGGCVLCAPDPMHPVDESRLRRLSIAE